MDRIQFWLCMSEMSETDRDFLNSSDFTEVAGYLSISGKMLKINQISHNPTIFCHF